MNGPESFTPDTRQIMGEAPSCRNLFVAAGFNSIGIMSSAGVGKRHGRMDSRWRSADGFVGSRYRAPRSGCRTSNRCLSAARLPEAVHNQFAMHWPFKQFESGRNLRRSPWHDLLAERGAVFGAPSGWERPLWYALGRIRGCNISYSYGEQSWWPMARREALHCSRHVSLFELSPFGKFDDQRCRRAQFSAAGFVARISISKRPVCVTA